MSLHSNVVAIRADIGALPDEQVQEIRDTGFTHYRRVEDDLIGKLAILRAACLILCDMAMADPDPATGLDACLRDLREETEGLILIMQSE